MRPLYLVGLIIAILILFFCQFFPIFILKIQEFSILKDKTKSKEKKQNQIKTKAKTSSWYTPGIWCHHPHELPIPIKDGESSQGCSEENGINTELGGGALHHWDIHYFCDSFLEVNISTQELWASLILCSWGTNNATQSAKVA